MIPVVWFTLTEGEHPQDKWDTGLLRHLFDGDVWSPVAGYEFEYTDRLPAEGGAVVVFPAGIHRDRYDEINDALAHLDWVLLILTADEGSLFEAKHIHHPNLRLWVMTPRPGYTYPDGTRFLGEGFAHGTPAVLAAADHDARPRGAFFAGQITHSRRRDMAGALDGVDGVDVVATPGFAQGMDRDVYLASLAETKVALAPSGPVTADSFRLYEALEAGCLPVADAVCPEWDRVGYWEMVAPGHPFPEVLNWSHAPGIVTNAVNDWPGNANHSFGWWQAHKRSMAYWLVDDLTDLGAPPPADHGHRDLITAIVCTSPIRSHPSTEIVEQTVASIRERLPDVEIIIGIDGINPKAEAEWAQLAADAGVPDTRRADYEEYTRRLLWLCNHEWHNVLPMVFGAHKHQSGMAVEALKLVHTPYVFYVEGDLPVCGEIPIDGFLACLEDGTADVIRLTLNTTLEPSHMHLMLDAGEKQVHHGVPMVRTVQWSQQPHMATTNYYRSIMSQRFRDGEATYIEWRMHSVCAGEWHQSGPLAWFRNRLWIYAPDGNMCRVIHLDGRSGETAYE